MNDSTLLMIITLITIIVIVICVIINKPFILIGTIIVFMFLYSFFTFMD
jgi:hypothetical protein